MENSRIYTKQERETLRSLLRGLVDEAKGIPVAQWGELVETELQSRGLKLDKKEIYNIVQQLTNNQPVWRAIHAVLSKERPSLMFYIDGDPIQKTKPLPMGEAVNSII